MAWYYSMAHCYNEAERLKPTMVEMNSVPRDLKLQVKQRVVDKPSSDTILENVILRFIVDEIEALMRRYCQGCLYGSNGQLPHESGCLMKWEKAVEVYMGSALPAVRSLECHMWCRNVLGFFDYDINKEKDLKAKIKKLDLNDSIQELCKLLKPSSS